jgi:hypothetical protein
MNKRFGWRGLVVLLLAPVFLVSSNGLPRTELAFAQAAIARAATPAPKPAWPVQALAALNYLSGGGPVGGWFPVSPVSNASDHHDEMRPSAAYNSLQQDYLVVWDQLNPDGFITSVYGQFLFPDGRPNDIRFRISPAGATSLNADVAYNPTLDQYLVVYEVGGNGIYGQIIGNAGSPVGPERNIVASVGSTYWQPAVAYSPTSGQYLVTWRRDQGTAKGIEARTLSGDGATVGTILEMTTLLPIVEPSHPDVAYNSARDQSLVVWQQWASVSDTTQHDIRGQAIHMTGVAHLEGPNFGIHATADEEMAPAVGAVAQPADTGKYLVVCQRYYPGGSTIDGQLVTGNGTLDPYVRISPSFGGSIPAVAGNEATQGYLVAWLQGSSEIQAREVSAWGYAVGTARSLPGQLTSHPAIASGPLGDFLITVDDRALPGYPFDVLGYLWGVRVYLPVVLRN